METKVEYVNVTVQVPVTYTVYTERMTGGNKEIAELATQASRTKAIEAARLEARAKLI